MTSTDYDSDSSTSDSAIGISTTVLLGYATKEPTDDTISHLGGEPSWFEQSDPPSAAFAQCRNCSEFMTLLLQLNGELPERFPGYERRLWIWACKRKACRRKRGSVRALRGTKVTEKPQSKPENGNDVRAEKVKATGEEFQKQNLGAALFGSKPAGSVATGNPFTTGHNPFSTPSIGSSDTNTFSSTSNLDQEKRSSFDLQTTALPDTFAQRLRIAPLKPSPAAKTPHVPWPPLKKRQKPYPCYNLDAEIELIPSTSTHTASTEAFTQVADSLNRGESSTSNAQSSNGVKTEDTMPDDAFDKVFEHFASVLSHNPEQVLRYEYSGGPLLYSIGDAVGTLLMPAGKDPSPDAKVRTMGSAANTRMPRCESCTAERVFELQLTPQAIAELEAEEPDGGIEGMEWGTIIVGVCSRNCGCTTGELGETAYVEEWVGVQWEVMIARNTGKKV